ncbi:MAG: GAF domain-containing protein, partial [Thermoanaerobaculia bacterium]
MSFQGLQVALEQVEAAIASKAGNSQALQTALDALALAFGAVTATLHRADPGTETLHLLACRGLPERVVEVTRTIPFGKGMAGLCARRREPVTVCNLQTDASGAARPGARETGVAGAIVVPV